MTVGKFVVLEGIECTGKGTIATHLKETRDLVFTREPGGTVFAEKMREILLSKEHTDIPPVAELYMFYAARMEHTVNKVVPALHAGKNVFSERYYDSTRAYQAAFTGDSLLVEQVHELFKPFLRKPDVTIYLDIPVDVCIERMQRNRGAAIMDKIESRGFDYFERVRQNYLNNADDTYIYVDATQPLVDVVAEVDRILDGLGL